VTRPRAADDFVAIRARMEELRRERASAAADYDSRQGERTTAKRHQQQAGAGRQGGAITCDPPGVLESKESIK